MDLEWEDTAQPLLDNWERVELFDEDIIDSFLVQYGLQPCCRCGDNDGTILCLICSRPFCPDCLEIMHGSFLAHSLAFWNGEMFEASASTSRAIIHCCHIAREQALGDTMVEVANYFSSTQCMHCAPSEKKYMEIIKALNHSVS